MIKPKQQHKHHNINSGWGSMYNHEKNINTCSLDDIRRS